MWKKTWTSYSTLDKNIWLCCAVSVFYISTTLFFVEHCIRVLLPKRCWACKSALFHSQVITELWTDLSHVFICVNIKSEFQIVFNQRKHLLEHLIAITFNATVYPVLNKLFYFEVTLSVLCSFHSEHFVGFSGSAKSHYQHIPWGWWEGDLMLPSRWMNAAFGRRT